jgi:hypothetical protein
MAAWVFIETWMIRSVAAIAKHRQRVLRTVVSPLAVTGSASVRGRLVVGYVRDLEHVASSESEVEHLQGAAYVLGRSLGCGLASVAAFG